MPQSGQKVNSWSWVCRARPAPPANELPQPDLAEKAAAWWGLRDWGGFRLPRRCWRRCDDPREWLRRCSVPGPDRCSHRISNTLGVGSQTVCLHGLFMAPRLVLHHSAAKAGRIPSEGRFGELGRGGGLCFGEGGVSVGSGRGIRRLEAVGSPGRRNRRPCCGLRCLGTTGLAIGSRLKHPGLRLGCRCNRKNGEYGDYQDSVHRAYSPGRIGVICTITIACRCGRSAEARRKGWDCNEWAG
jgi:hypothetical protein